MEIKLGARQPEIDRHCADKRSILSAHEFFSNLSASAIARLAERARIGTYSPGTAIVAKDDEGHSLFVILAGLARVSGTSEDGRATLLNLLRPPDLFGEIALLDGGRRTATVTAMTECRLLVLDGRDFISTLTNEPIVGLTLLATLASGFRRLSEQIEDFSFAVPSRRLAKALLRFARISATSGEYPHVAITQKELGEAVSLSRESTNRQLRKWEAAGYIRLEKGGYTITNKHALLRLSGGDSSDGL